MRAGAWRGARALLITGVLVAGGLVAAPQAAHAAYADDPTWAEVQAAKRDVAEKAAAVQRIESALGGLESDAARLGTAALEAAATAGAAERRLTAAQATTDRLEGEAGAAAHRATAARRTAGAVAAQLARGGDPALGVWLAGDRSGSLLRRLGALAKI
ncbi:M23 family peptidase, partial [Amnibacterium endophyticum]